MKIINIGILMLLLFASLSFSFKSENKGFETSSEVEYNQELIAMDNLMVTIQNPEFFLFNEESIQIRLDCPTEVLIVLKHPGYSVGFSHSLIYSILDKYLTMG